MDGEISLVRPDGASRRGRWQQFEVQAPAGQTIWGGLFWLLFGAVAKK